MDNKLLLSVAEAADQLSISRAHLYVLLKDGDLPSVKLGKVRRIPVEGLRAFVARQIEASDPRAA